MVTSRMVSVRGPSTETKMKTMSAGFAVVLSVLLLSTMVAVTAGDFQTINNVTLWTGDEAKFVCDKSFAATISPDWIMYNYSYIGNVSYVNTTVLEPGLNPEKYTFENGNTTLVVKNIEKYDSATYCCIDPRNIQTEYCGNLLVIVYLDALVQPRDGVAVDSDANLNCSYAIYRPSSHSPYPTSDKQELKMTMFIDDTDISSDVRYTIHTFGPDPYYYRLSQAQNRTMKKSDGQNLVCRLSAISPQVPADRNSASVPLNIIRSAVAQIAYPNNVSAESYPIGSVFVCNGYGYPETTAVWVDLSTGQRLNSTDSSSRNSSSLVVTNNGSNATLEVNDNGKFNLNCSAWNSQNDVPSNMTIQIIVGNSSTSIQVQVQLLGWITALTLASKFLL